MVSPRSVVRAHSFRFVSVDVQALIRQTLFHLFDLLFQEGEGFSLEVGVVQVHTSTEREGGVPFFSASQDIPNGLSHECRKENRGVW